jgi:hypothetical protein
VVSASVGGRWGMPRSDLAESLSFLDAEAEDEAFRVVWLGAPEVLPLGSWPLADATSYATTLDGTAEFQDLWPGPPERDDAPLRSALDLALDLDTTRLGRLLAPGGVRYVVVVDAAAPAPYGGESVPVPPAVIDALEQQLDLVRIELNPDITLYRNEAWAPRVSALPAGTVPADDGATSWESQASRTLLSGSVEPVPAAGLVAAEGPVDERTEILIGSSPSQGWDVELDGADVELDTAFEWTAVADTAAGGEATVAWTTPTGHRLALAAQLALVLAAALVLYATRAEVRDRRPRRRVAPTDRTPSNPVGRRARRTPGSPRHRRSS